VVLESKMGMKEVEKRFGVIAVDMGYITIEQLLDALEIQVREDLAEKKHRIIGRILYDMGLLTFPQIERVIASLNSDSLSRRRQSDGVSEG
jgi:hypothetical protein